MPARLLMLADVGAFRLLTFEAILQEVGKDLRDGKVGWPEAEIGRALRQLARIAERVEDTAKLAVIAADPADKRVLDCTDAGWADFIISGDKHLLAFSFTRTRQRLPPRRENQVARLDGELIPALQ